MNISASWLLGIVVGGYALLSTLIKLINALRHKDYSYVKALLLILSLIIIVSILLFVAFPYPIK